MVDEIKKPSTIIVFYAERVPIKTKFEIGMDGNQTTNTEREMPNGVRRQRNTRHANRHRNIQRANEVQAEPVQDTPVVQAEVVEGRIYTADEVEGMIDRGCGALMRQLMELKESYEDLLDDYKKMERRVDEESDLLDRYQKLKSKYNQAKSGNLLAFQEVEIEDLQQENFELKAELGEAEEKIDQLLRDSEDKVISNGNEGVGEFVKMTFVKTWQREQPATFHIDGRPFTVIPHNCAEMKDAAKHCQCGECQSNWLS